MLIEVSNFNALRRVLGRPRAGGLIDIVAEVAGAAAGCTNYRVVGRALIELELFGDDRTGFEHRLDAVETAFAHSINLDGEMHRIDVVVAAAAASPSSTIDDVRLTEMAEDALTLSRHECRRVVHDADEIGVPDEASSLRDELGQAIVGGELFVQYQPKLHVRRQEVASAEALIRWNHPSRGLVLPADFIPLAEQSGLIEALTLWTLRQVIADQADLRASGHDLTLFVNISGQLLSNVRFINDACVLIAACAGRIGFEITETSTISDPEIAIEHLKTVAGYGVPIAIDDYGAGLSSLAYLKQLPATELKIDKMFVMELTSSHRDPLIVRSTIDLAHAMEMEVTAEGVETPAALALLTVMGCDLVQGYLLSRPLSLDAFRHYLANDLALPESKPSFPLGRATLRKGA